MNAHTNTKIRHNSIYLQISIWRTGLRQEYLKLKAKMIHTNQKVKLLNINPIFMRTLRTKMLLLTVGTNNAVLDLSLLLIHLHSLEIYGH